MEPLSPPLDLAFRYHQAIPPRIREYLHDRGISDRIIDLHILGWNGARITIPIFDRAGRLAFFKLARDPDDKAGPKMLVPRGVRAELYGWERVREEIPLIVICEGEFDRLVLEDHGIPAVTSTGGAGVFRPEWAQALGKIGEVYICFDRDEAGKRGTIRVAQLARHARVVELPEEVGEGGDITDFFVRLARTREEFLGLLNSAQSIPITYEPELPHDVPRATIPRGEAAEVKSSVRIEDVIQRYRPLRPCGHNLIASCPFHEDRTPSLVVYPETQTFYCFGCLAHGDVFSFLMKIEGLTFSEALRVLKGLPLS